MTTKFRIANRDSSHKLLVRFEEKDSEGAWSGKESSPLAILGYGDEFEGHVWSTRRFIVEELDPKLEITT